MNLCYVGLRGEHEVTALHTDFDPETFSEGSSERRMRYFAKKDSRFWVEVMISKIDRSIETRKSRGVRLVSTAIGPDFRTAMIQATITGLLNDEPADES